MNIEGLCLGYDCPACGKRHESLLKRAVISEDAISCLPETVSGYNAKRVFLLADVNTYRVAGERVDEMLKKAGCEVRKCILKWDKPAPDERSVGAALMHYDASSDIIVGVGSGVINDIGKLVANAAQKPYIIVATAPSMDGYASATSSMERDGLKTSVPSKCPDVVIGDVNIIKDAPMQMLRSGLGDMLAKYVSLCEWRIGETVCGEYYCPYVAELVRGALKKCIENADGLISREPDAVKAVMEGLVIGGIAMNYAGVSRPASGVEHYISHVWDMRGLELGTPTELHGIQCAIGTLLAVKLYEKLKNIRNIDRETALERARRFDYGKWSEQLKKLLGKAADPMIALEAREGKYSLEAHERRLGIIIENWDRILGIIEEELPASSKIEKILKDIDAPVRPSEIGISEDDLPTVMRATADIRDKYVLSRLAWDLGIGDELFGKAYF